MDEGWYSCLSKDEDLIREIIARDGKDEFVSFLERSSVINSGNLVKLKFSESELLLHKLLGWICYYRAVHCGIALVERKMDLKVDLNIPIHQGAFPLHEAAYSLSPGLIELFLSHGAQPDSRCDHVDSEYYGLLPLHIALKRLSSDKNLIQWTPSQSIVELIIMLCLPKMEEALETTRLLALNTKEIEEVIRFYAKRGKVTDLAVLLMVARKKFMDPITLLDKDGFTLKGCMTFRRCIRSELAALINIEYGIMGLNEEEELFEVCRERKMVMMSTLLMLEIFERAGDAIDEYLQSKQSNKSEEQVAQEVASLLAEAGFDTDSRDIGDSWLLESGVPIQEQNNRSEEFAGCGSGQQVICMPPYTRLDMLFDINPSRGIQNEEWSLIRTPFSRGSAVRPFYAFWTSRAGFCSGFPKTQEVQVKERTKGMELCMQNFPASK